MPDSVITPWGPSDELRERRLRPGPGIPREDVERNQRERLYGAMVATIDEVGYEGMRVGLVAERAGVSRSTLYEYFADRQECFLATFDALVSESIERIATAYDPDERWDLRLRKVLEQVIALILEQPASARLCLLELYCVGKEAGPRRDSAAAALENLGSLALAESPERADMPPAIVSGTVGGMRTVLQRYLLRGAEDELPELTEDLWKWAISYRMPPTPLKPQRPRRARSPRREPTDPVGRLLEAVMRTVHERGYAETRVSDVAAAASMSLSTFYSHFPGKQEVYLAACETGMARAYHAALEDVSHEGYWPRRIHAGLYEFLSFMAAEPEWAYAAGAELFSAGARAQRRRDRMIDLFTARLTPGFERAPDLGPIAREATGGAIYTLLHNQIRNEGADKVLAILPAATYMALAPFIGAEEAAEIANEPV